MNTKHNFKISLVDTDSISFYKENFDEFSAEEIDSLLKEINSLLPPKVKFDLEDYFDKILCIKTKNYVLVNKKGKQTLKGSALRNPNRETRLADFIKQTVNLLLDDNSQGVVDLYTQYIKEIIHLQDISGYVSKKTVTKAVLNPERTNEQKVFDALKDEVGIQEGDKIWVYFDKDDQLKLKQHWTGDHNQYRLMEKLWKTVDIFAPVIDMKLFPKYHLKTKRKLLEGL